MGPLTSAKLYMMSGQNSSPVMHDALRTWGQLLESGHHTDFSASQATSTTYYLAYAVGRRRRRVDKRQLTKGREHAEVVRESSGNTVAFIICVGWLVVASHTLRSLSRTCVFSRAGSPRVCSHRLCLPPPHRIAKYVCASPHTHSALETTTPFACGCEPWA